MLGHKGCLLLVFKGPLYCSQWSKIVCHLKCGRGPFFSIPSPALIVCSFFCSLMMAILRGMTTSHSLICISMIVFQMLSALHVLLSHLCALRNVCLLPIFDFFFNIKMHEMFVNFKMNLVGSYSLQIYFNCAICFDY